MNGRTIGFVLGGFLVVSVIRGVMNGAESPTSPSTVSPAEQAEQQKQDEQYKMKEVVTFGVIDHLYSAMRDPDSLKILSAFVPDNDKVLISCVEYSAKNGFGGRNREFAVGTSTNGDFQFSANNARIWNKMCAGKTGTDFNYYSKFALDRIKAHAS